jgi:hypothetical protein
MKYIKLFENFSEEGFPKSITIEPTNEFRKEMESHKVYDPSKQNMFGFVDPDFVKEGHKLFYGGNESNPKYNIVKIGTIPLDISTNLQKDFWASYNPYVSEIYVIESTASIENLKKIESSFVKPGELMNDWQVLQLKNDKGQSIFRNGYYCKFENGFKVGEVDNRGYFEIVSVK